MPRRWPHEERTTVARASGPYGGYSYAAFVLNPDGHNIEAVYHVRPTG